MVREGGMIKLAYLAIRQFVGGVKDDTMRVAFGSAWILDENHGEIWRADLEKLKSLRAPP